MVQAVNNPGNPEDGTRQVPFTGALWIERDDFAQVPPPKFFRLSPGKEVRLRAAYFVTATDVVKDEAGNIVQVNATYDPASKGGNSPDGRKVKSTMHWVSAHAVDAAVALYDRLFSAEHPGEATGDDMDDLNPDSRELLTGAKVEPALAETAPGEVVQFERLGYFAHDPARADALPPHGRPARRVGQHPEAPGVAADNAAGLPLRCALTALRGH